MPQPLPDVPDADPDATVDPAWSDLRTNAALPGWYQPAAMPTQVAGWRRAAAWTVVVMLVSSASAGLCLTYGPDELWRFLGIG